MKKIILVFIMMYSGILCSQTKVELSSLIFDRVLRTPIAYANVGFIDRGVGTVTDKEGYFEFSFMESHVTNKDTLQISAQGYYPLRIAFSRLQSVLDKTKVLYLSKLSDENKNLRHLSENSLVKDYVGSVADSEVTIGWSEKDKKGAELASLIDLSSNVTSLEQLKFRIAEHKADSTLVRINIYDVGPDNIPGKKIVKSIYHIIKRKEGEELVAINAKEVISSPKVIVGIERLESFGVKGNQLQFIMSTDIGTSFVKSTSQDSWEILPFNSIGFLLDVLNMGDAGDVKKRVVEESKVTGVVTLLGRPFQGCEVRIKDKLSYVQTNRDGSFNIAAITGDVLEFRSLFTESKNIKVENPQKINVFLKLKYDSLSEVVVNSYSKEDQEIVSGLGVGPQKKRSLGYSARSLGIDEFNKFALTFEDLIRGKFPGLSVGTGIGRGHSSFTLSNKIAVVLDGAVFVGDTNLISPSIVANISYVPGLAGNTVYGSNGRNGVLYITTKSAMQNRKLLEEKEIVNSLLVEGNDYDGLAKRYEAPVYFKTVASNLENSSSFEEAKAVYLKELELNLLNVNFYKEAFIYFKKWDEEYAYDILNIAISIANHNSKALRSIAFIFEENGRFGIAHEIYKRIGELEPRRSQSYMDLAQSYTSIGEYEKAFSLYKLILDNKIPGVVFGDTVLEIAVTEVKYLVTKHKIDLDYRDLHPSFYSKAQDLDGRIVFEWNDPLSEFEIQFVNPNKKYFTWQHTLNSQPKELLKERVQGYNTKEFVLEESDPGIWLINIKGYKVEEKNNQIPRFVKCTLYKDYGMPEEIKQIKVIELRDIFDNNFSIARLELN
ncbi:hypothetical protein [Aquimarina sp. AD1]|uniref:hypothetical protein n=1 Tax=Aquimarina sp. (strain AD1) TaxID=1714848 RepID=UPI000EB9FA51|nr:hypothetical protein [Aquimarina sp. AD1]RKN17688.1 hypothetical protein D7035_14680 [Aquimarina sp. AD1]